MRIWRSGREFLKRNPAVELLLGVGVCTAALTPLWILAGKIPRSSRDSSKDDINLELYKDKSENEKLRNFKLFLTQEHEKLMKEHDSDASKP